jgi:hypothetical protein
MKLFKFNEVNGRHQIAFVLAESPLIAAYKLQARVGGVVDFDCNCLKVMGMGWSFVFTQDVKDDLVFVSLD